MGFQPTYPEDPHSRFLDVRQNSHDGKPTEIFEMCHGLGLHFDAVFHQVEGEPDLDTVRQDAGAAMRFFASSAVFVVENNGETQRTESEPKESEQARHRNA